MSTKSRPTEAERADFERRDLRDSCDPDGDPGSRDSGTTADRVEVERHAISSEEAEAAVRALRDQLNLGVRLAMTEAGWTSAAEAGRYCLISESAFRAYLNGQNSWTVDSLAKFQAASGVPIWDIWRRGHDAWAARRDRELRDTQELDIVRDVLRQKSTAAVEQLMEEVLAERKTR